MAAQQEIARLVIRLQAQTAEMRSELKTAEGTIQSFAAGARKLLAGIGVGVGVGALVNELKQAVAFAIDYNSEMEQQKLGIASVLTATSQITDHAGRQLEGQEKLDAALRISGDIYEDIRVAALRTAATTPEIVQGFQGMIAPAQKAGLSLKETLDVSVALTQAMRAMNLPMMQMRVEALGLLEGQQSVRTDVMNRLGIEGEIVKKMREQGQLYDYLMEKLAPFAVAGEKQLGTWQGLKSSLEDVVSVLGAMAGKPIFEAATESLEGLLALLTTGKTDVIEFSAAAQGAADSIGATIQVVIDHFRTFKTEYAALWELVKIALQTVNVAFSGFLMGLSVAWWQFYGLVFRVAEVIDLITFGKIPGMRETVNQMRTEFARLTEEVKVQAYDVTKAWGEAGRTIRGDMDRSMVGAKLEGRTPEELAKVKKAIDELYKPKVVPAQAGAPSAEQIEAAEKATEKLAKKTSDLKTELTSLSSPVQASKMALEAFIAETTKGAAETPELKTQVDALRASFTALRTAQEGKARVEAVDKASLADFTQGTENALQALETSLERGEVDLEAYFARRRQIITAQAAEEIRILEASRAREPEAPKRIEIEAQIRVKREELTREIVSLNLEEEESYKKLFAAVREGELSDTFEQTETALLALQNRFVDGLVTIREYYAERKRLAAETDAAEIASLQEKLSVGTEEVERIEIATEIRRKQAQAQREQTQLNHEETESLKRQAQELLQIRSMMAGMQLRAAPKGGGELEAQFNQELALLDQQHATELEKIQELADEKIKIGEDYYTKQELLDEAYRLHKLEKEKLLHDQETRLQLSRLNMASRVVGGLGDMFDQLYQASGGKLKAFFYLSKAISIAQAIINTAEGVTKALAQGGRFGTAMAGIIMATGAAQIALITQQTIQGPGMAEGGLITAGAGPRRDDVPVRASRGEFMQPADSVAFYGPEIMEALRRKLVPRETFDEIGAVTAGITVRTPAASALAEGGLVSNVMRATTSRGGDTINVPVSVTGVEGAGLAVRLQDEIEETVIRVLRDYA